MEPIGQVTPVTPPVEILMDNLVAQKLAMLAWELQTTAIRMEAQHEASMETTLALYGIVDHLRTLVQDVDAYRRKS